MSARNIFVSENLKIQLMEFNKIFGIYSSITYLYMERLVTLT